MFDVARIICGCCDADVRRETERTLVEDYYSLLVELMAEKARPVHFGVKQVGSPPSTPDSSFGPSVSGNCTRLPHSICDIYANSMASPTIFSARFARAAKQQVFGSFFVLFLYFYKS